jgi:mono/diheme cytochrome c family protein
MKKILVSMAVIATLALPAFALAADDAAAEWNKTCAKCHGKEGKGDTKMGQKLGVKDYTNAEVQAKLTDEQMTAAIKNGAGTAKGGSTPMPAYGSKLSDAQVAELVKHIRSFKK